MKITEIQGKFNTETIHDIIKRDIEAFDDKESVVKKILSDIRENKDSALFSYMERFDNIKLSPENVQVSCDEIEAALKEIDKDLMDTMKRAADNIRSFHEKINIEGFLDKSRPGIILGQRVTPLSRVGIYVPGGKAYYPSTVLMDAIPAKVAKVGEIIMITPPGRDGKIAPAIIAAAVISGVDRIFKISGAQGVGAMAYGTETVPRVDKIIGPGNIYVALAKKLVFGDVGIDSVAGPSEITVLCDKNANPRYAAADILSQTEHDEMAQGILVTDNKAFALRVLSEIEELSQALPRKDIIEKSLSDNGNIFVCSSMEECIDIVNIIAPEHLEIMVKEPFSILNDIKNAGAIFLGEYSGEPLGDYFAGPNHVLPTNGTARFFSPLSTEDFVKKSSIICYDRDAFNDAAFDIIKFAESEGLSAHANSVRVRYEQ